MPTLYSVVASARFYLLATEIQSRESRCCVTWVDMSVEEMKDIKPERIWRNLQFPCAGFVKTIENYGTVIDVKKNE